MITLERVARTKAKRAVELDYTVYKRSNNRILSSTKKVTDDTNTSYYMESQVLSYLNNKEENTNG